MASIDTMRGAGWGDPGREGSDTAARFRANHIRNLRHRGITIPTNSDGGGDRRQVGGDESEHGDLQVRWRGRLQ